MSAWVGLLKCVVGRTFNCHTSPARLYPRFEHYAVANMFFCVCTYLFRVCAQGGLVVSAAGFYYPAINITGLTAGQVVSIDDLEVRVEAV